MQLNPGELGEFSPVESRNRSLPSASEAVYSLTLLLGLTLDWPLGIFVHKSCMHIGEAWLIAAYA